MLTTTWKKSSRSGHNGACVEARLGLSTIEIRDSKLADSPILKAAAIDWKAILGPKKLGQRKQLN